MSISFSKLFRHVAPVAAVCALVVAMQGTWATAQPVTTAASRATQGVTSAAGAASATGSAAAADAPRTASASRASRASASEASDSSAAEPGERRGARPGRKEITGKINLNTATEEQLMLLPTVGPSKAERIVTWRKKNGGFKRTADLRRVKGFGYKTFKRLEPFLDIKGETTLAAK
jgi:competence ComEA-like helix-hairpin-helix protein